MSAINGHFALGTFSASGDVPFPGLVTDGHVRDLRADFGDDSSVLALFADWDANKERLTELTATGDAAIALSELRAHAPIVPRQVLCAGANYTQHVTEMAFAFMKRDGDPRPDEELRAEAQAVVEQLSTGDPYLFAGLPSALTGPEDDVVLWGPGKHHDWELELAVVIGRGGRDIPIEEAMSHVAGYTISNDISTRDLLARPNFPMSDIVMTKNRPTFFPTGPHIVPSEAVPDPSKLRITLSVNGEVMQDASVDGLMHSIDRLISYASRAIALLPGDLLLTGSPSGNAAHHGNRWLRPGDVMEGEISGIGRIRNRCVAES